MKLLGNNPQFIIPQGVMTPNMTISEISSSLVITHKDVPGFATKMQGYSPKRSYARLLGTLTSGRGWYDSGAHYTDKRNVVAFENRRTGPCLKSCIQCMCENGALDLAP